MNIDERTALKAMFDVYEFSDAWVEVTANGDKERRFVNRITGEQIKTPFKNEEVK